MSVQSTLDFKAIRANRNIAARNYWKSRMANAVLKRYFDCCNGLTHSATDGAPLVGSGKASDELNIRLHQLAANDKAKCIVLLATLAILANKYSGTDDIVLFIPCFLNSQQPDNANTTIPFRVRDFTHMPFREVLLTVKDLLLQDMNHINFPLEKKMNRETGDLPGAYITGIHIQGVHETAACEQFRPGILFSFGVGNELTLQISGKYYRDPWLARLPEHYFTLLQHLMDNPGKPIADIDIISPNEKQQVLSWSNNIFPVEQTAAPSLVRLWEQQVARNGRKTAVKWQGDELSFDQLNDQANKQARYLLDKGIGNEDAVAIILERSPDYIVSLLAVLKTGATFVPIDPAYGDESISYRVKDCRAICVIGREETFARRHIRFLPAQVCIDKHQPAIDKYDPGNLPITDNDITFIQYKATPASEAPGIVYTKAFLLNHLQWEHINYPYSEDDIACLLADFRCSDHIAAILSPLLQGVTLVIANDSEALDAEKTAALIAEKKISRIGTSPRFLQKLLNSAGENNNDISSLRYVMCSGEGLRSSLAREFYALCRGSRLVNVYTSDETGPAASLSMDEDPQAMEDILPVGKPVANRRIYVTDSKGNLQPVGVPGEIWIAGPGIKAGDLTRPGVLDQPSAEAPPFIDGPAWRSGDTGRWLADGTLEWLGSRADEVAFMDSSFRLSGMEQLICRKFGLEEAVVVVWEHGDHPYLVVYYTGPVEIKDAALQACLAEWPGLHQVPAQVMRLAQFPRNARGSADRTLLPQPAIGEEEKHVAPANEWENKLADIWSEVLHIEKEKISTNTSFFHLGGHSLRAITLVNKIHGAFGINISVKEVFKRKSIQNLSRLLQTSERSDYAQFRKAEEREYYDLSISQMRLYYLHELDHSSLTLNIPTVFKLEGRLNIEKLHHAFHSLIMRQESLRTYFRVINDRPVQLIANSVQFDIEIFDATEGEIDAVARQFIRPFNISIPPLFRVALIRTSPEVSYLMVDIHHIITDGTSMGLLAKDFMALYGEKQLPALELQYRDYATWQQSKGYKRRSAEQKDFWINEFSEPILPLDLPVDFIMPSSSATDGDVLNFELSPKETLQLRSIATAEVVTSSMLILAILNVLFAKMANQEDIVIGMAAAGREEFALDNMIGMFPVVLPLRNYPRAGLKFSEFLAALKTKFLSALDNQGYHYEELARELKMERSTARNPWFDVLFLYQNYEKADLTIPDIRVSLYKEKNIVAHEKLNISVTENGEKMFFRIVYSKLLFRSSTIERLVKYFKKVVKCIIKDVNVSIMDIELVSKREINHLLRSFNKQAKEISHKETYSDLFRRQVQHTPLNVAVEHNREKLTYQELFTRVEMIASHLCRAGIHSNKNVVLYAPPSIHMLTGLLGILHAGSAYVPIDVSFPEERVKEILADTGAEVIITTREMAAVTEQYSITVPTLKHIIYLEEIGNTEIGYNGVEAGTGDLAYIIYTSGTTGKPKGVMVHQLGMINHLYAMIEVLGLGEKDVIAQTASPAFDISVWQFLTALIVGGKTLIIDNDKIMDPKALIAELQQKAVTVFQSVPSLMTRFLAELSQHSLPFLPHLRWMIPTGESLPVLLAKKWYAMYPRIPLLNAYGPAEASDDVTTQVVDPPREGQLAIPVGRAIRNMHVYILDASLRLCPVGVKGEICVAGLGVGKGYWKDEDKTRKAFIPNPIIKSDRHPDYSVLYKTGDIGYYLEDGTVVCLGRKDDQVKVRGFRIELGEIESRLLRHEAIREAVVLVKEWAGDKQLVAYYVSDKEIETPELQKFVAGKLPNYMVPSCFIHLMRFPVTSNGKLDKRALPEPEIKSNEAYIRPATETEEKLVDIWSEVLNIVPREIGIDASFFHMGGHSLNAITIINKIHHAFNVEISFREFFISPTIKNTAEFIDARLGLQTRSDNGEESCQRTIPIL